MSFLRIRSPYHEPRSTDFVDLGPSSARASARGGIRGGSGVVFGALAVGVSRYSAKVERRTGAHSPKYRPGVSRDIGARRQKNPDNGAVEASITEVQT